MQFSVNWIGGKENLLHITLSDGTKLFGKIGREDEDTLEFKTARQTYLLNKAHILFIRTEGTADEKAPYPSNINY